MGFTRGVKNRSAIVIGAGVGGLSAAIYLARAGLKVRVYERAPRVGGKLREVDVDGKTFDAGPSVLTMKWVFDELFAGRFGEYVKLGTLEPLCRHFFPDGSVLDLFTDEERAADAIEKFSGAASARGYREYRKHAKKIFDVVREPFMENAIPHIVNFIHPRALTMLTQIDAMRTLHKALEEFFPDPRLRQLFGRYATYNGSSPYQAPATLSVIVHVENAFGIFTCEGGIYRLAEALERLARELGVEIITGAEVEEIVTETTRSTFSEESRAIGIRLRSGAVEKADAVLANCDVADVYERLLNHTKTGRKLARKYSDEERSLSAYVWLAVAEPPPFDILHHNVFFSTDYKHEFKQLFGDRTAPDDPTVYLNAQDRAGTPPSGPERMFFLSNAPALEQGGRSNIDWAHGQEVCRDRIVSVMARHGWQVKALKQKQITPLDLATQFPASRGSIYGLSLNAMTAAFKRPQNKIAGVRGLYLAGGSVHPGAGLPMVAMSARIASQLALTDLAG